MIYSCAGGCNVGQIANAAAIKLDQEELGTLFCLAAIGGHVDDLTQRAIEAAETVVIDGCGVACARLTLNHAGVEPHAHVVVTDLGIEKNRNFELSAEEVQQVVDAVKSPGGESGEASSDEGCSCCSEE